MSTVAGSFPYSQMPTVADPGIKAMRSDGGVGVVDHSSFSERFLEWGNSPSVAMFWAIVGCICSFFCPLFLLLEEGRAFSDPGPIRVMIMLPVCSATAGIYHVGYTLRHHRIMRERPHFLVESIGMVSTSIIVAVLASTVINGGTWSTVVGFELLLVAFFVLLEMARPAHDFYLLRNLSCLPVIAGARGDHGWDLIDLLGWPMITVLLPLLFMTWREFFIFNHKGKI